MGYSIVIRQEDPPLRNRFELRKVFDSIIVLGREELRLGVVSYAVKGLTSFSSQICTKYLNTLPLGALGAFVLL